MTFLNPETLLLISPLIFISLKEKNKGRNTKEEKLFSYLNFMELCNNNVMYRKNTLKMQYMGMFFFVNRTLLKRTFHFKESLAP